MHTATTGSDVDRTMSDQRVRAAGGGLAAAILLGYIFSRTTGLPNATTR